MNENLISKRVINSNTHIGMVYQETEHDGKCCVLQVVQNRNVVKSAYIPVKMTAKAISISMDLVASIMYMLGAEEVLERFDMSKILLYASTEKGLKGLPKEYRLAIQEKRVEIENNYVENLAFAGKINALQDNLI